MNLASLVETCHSAENVFDALRRGDLELNAEIMDAVLQALDVVTDNMDSLRAGEELAPPAPELIQTLRGFVSSPAPKPAATPAPAKSEQPAPAALDPAEQAFEAMLAESQAEPDPASSVASGDSDLITDDEFE